LILYYKCLLQIIHISFTLILKGLPFCKINKSCISRLMILMGCILIASSHSFRKWCAKGKSLRFCSPPLSAGWVSLANMASTKPMSRASSSASGRLHFCRLLCPKALSSRVSSKHISMSWSSRRTYSSSFPKALHRQEAQRLRETGTRCIRRHSRRSRAQILHLEMSSNLSRPQVSMRPMGLTGDIIFLRWLLKSCRQRGTILIMDRRRACMLGREVIQSCIRFPKSTEKKQCCIIQGFITDSGIFQLTEYSLIKQKSWSSFLN